MLSFRALPLALALAAAACTRSAPRDVAAVPSGSTPTGPAASASADASPGALAPGGPALADDLVGKKAPDFTATAQDGALVHLDALRGKPVVVYFYPKDETPGCTKEACSFRDAWQAIAQTGAVLVGVSADPSESHKAFAEHYKLPFLLVSDPDGAIARAYGVPFEGRHKRQTVIIGRDGKVAKVYRTVDVTVHASQVLGDLQSMS